MHAADIARRRVGKVLLGRQCDQLVNGRHRDIGVHHQYIRNGGYVDYRIEIAKWIKPQILEQTWIDRIGTGRTQ